LSANFVLVLVNINCSDKHLFALVDLGQVAFFQQTVGKHSVQLFNNFIELCNQKC